MGDKPKAPADAEPQVEGPKLSQEQMKLLIATRAKELESTARADGTTKTKLAMTDDGCISQTVTDAVAKPAADEATDAAFEASEAFAGSRPGFVFKMGPQGLGYYTDNQGRLLKALDKLEARIDPKAAATRALASKAAASPAPSAGSPGGDTDVPEGKRFSVEFSEAKWGMTARMVAGPVAVTKLREGGQAGGLGVEVGDVVAVVDGISVTDNRSQALARLRQGGACTVTFVRPDQPVAAPPSVAGLAEAEAAAAVRTLGGDAGGGDDAGWSVKQMQAMIGAAKAKDAVTVAGKRGVTETIADGQVDANSTLVIVGCEDCTFRIESYCVKLYVQDCRNLTLHANTRIVTSMIEVFKGNDVTLHVNTDCGTLQADMVDGLAVKVASKERFTQAVWAGCERLSVTFGDAPDALTTGYSELAAADPTLSRERSQFRIARVAGRVVQEKVIRLENGFTTTMREKQEFELKQEANLKAMAKTMGITIGRPSDGVRVKPNEPCPCGSGLKFKKCCFSVDGKYRGPTAKAVGPGGAAPTAVAAEQQP